MESGRCRVRVSPVHEREAIRSEDSQVADKQLEPATVAGSSDDRLRCQPRSIGEQDRGLLERFDCCHDHDRIAFEQPNQADIENRERTATKEFALGAAFAWLYLASLPPGCLQQPGGNQRNH